MINHKKVLVLIPARKGSKGIIDKNIVSLGGKPLIWYSIDVAQKTRYVDKVVVSSDSEKYLQIANSFGADTSRRPSKLAQDETKTIDVVRYEVGKLEKAGERYDIIVLLQPTQPFRTACELEKALEKFVDNHEKGLVSVRRVVEHPIFMRKIIDDRLYGIFGSNSTIRRQELAPIYRVDGSIYINSKSEIFSPSVSLNDNQVPFEIQSEFYVDIDKYEDLEYANWKIQKKDSNYI